MPLTVHAAHRDFVASRARSAELEAPKNFFTTVSFVATAVLSSIVGDLIREKKSLPVLYSIVANVVVGLALSLCIGKIVSLILQPDLDLISQERLGGKLSYLFPEQAIRGESLQDLCALKSLPQFKARLLNFLDFNQMSEARSVFGRVHFKALLPHLNQSNEAAQKWRLIEAILAAQPGQIKVILRDLKVNRDAPWYQEFMYVLERELKIAGRDAEVQKELEDAAPFVKTRAFGLNGLITQGVDAACKASRLEEAASAEDKASINRVVALIQNVPVYNSLPHLRLPQKEEEVLLKEWQTDLKFAVAKMDARTVQLVEENLDTLCLKDNLENFIGIIEGYHSANLEGDKLNAYREKLLARLKNENVGIVKKYEIAKRYNLPTIIEEVRNSLKNTARPSEGELLLAYELLEGKDLEQFCRFWAHSRSENRQLPRWNKEFEALGQLQTDKRWSMQKMIDNWPG